MRFYRKSDANLLAAVMDERDQAHAELATVKAALVSAEGARDGMRDIIASQKERIQVLEAEQQKHVESQRGIIDKFMAASVESNAPVNWSEREQVKVNAAPPRSVMATLKERAIKNALASQKKPEVVQ